MRRRKKTSRAISVRRCFLMVKFGFKMAVEFMKVLFFKMKKITVVFIRKKSFQLIFLIDLIPLMMVLQCICTSCKVDSSPDDPFLSLYNSQSLDSLPKSNSESFKSTFFLTFSANKVPFSLLARVISDKFNIGLVFSHNLSDKKITAEFKNTNLNDVLNVLSRQLDVDVVPVGNTFFIGKLRSEDRGILVRKVIGFSNDELKTACLGVMSDKGKCSVIGAGIVSASDYQSVILRLSELLDYFGELREPVWILQLAFLTLNRELLLEAGVKITTSGTLSYNLDDNEFSAKNINIDGIINSAFSSSFTDVYSCPMVLIREGSVSEWKYGKRVPIPRKTVSDYGTVSTTGFDYVDVGFSLKASISRSHTGGILSLFIGKSDIESYVEYAPIISQNNYSFTVDMAPRRPYLLGELSTFKDLNTQSDILNFGKTKGKNSVQVWGQLYRISPGVLRPYPDPKKKTKSRRSERLSIATP